MAKAYDRNNVFAKILRGEIPCRKLHETAHSLAFADINPLAPVHVLVIPKGAYVDYEDFADRASPEEMVDYVKAIGDTAKLAGTAADGYRLLSNCGVNANQEVPHLHVHIFGGRRLGRMLKKDGD